MVDDQIKVTHDNNGRFYRIKMDLAKEGSELWDLTPYFKGRVGDNRFGLQVVWTYQGRLLDTTGMKPYIEGNVGNYSFDDKKDLQLAPDAATVRYTGNPSDCQSGGRATYYFPEQMFPRDGIFKGYIGLLDDRDDSSQPHISGVTVWFRVLPGIAQMGHACDVYISDLDKALQNFQVKLDQHDQDYQTKLQQVIDDARNAYESETKNAHDSLDALKSQIQANRDEQENLTNRLAGTEQQIEIHDVVTRPEFFNLSNQLTQQVSQMKEAGLEFFNNADDLKAKYPQGANKLCVTLDDSHEWVYDYANNQWNDAGAFNYGVIDPKLTRTLYTKDPDNLIVNSDFNGLDMWTARRDQTNSNVYIDTDDAVNGSNTVVINGYVKDGSSNESWILSQDFPVNTIKNPAISLGLEAYVQGINTKAGDTAGLELNMIDKDGNTTRWRKQISNNTDYQKVTWENIILPSNTVSCHIAIFMYGLGQVKARRPQANFGTRLLPYSKAEIINSFPNRMLTSPIVDWSYDNALFTVEKNITYAGQPTLKASTDKPDQWSFPTSPMIKVDPDSLISVSVPLRGTHDYVSGKLHLEINQYDDFNSAESEADRYDGDDLAALSRDKFKVYNFNGIKLSPTTHYITVKVVAYGQVNLYIGNVELFQSKYAYSSISRINDFVNSKDCFFNYPINKWRVITSAPTDVTIDQSILDKNDEPTVKILTSNRDLQQVTLIQGAPFEKIKVDKKRFSFKVTYRQKIDGNKGSLIVGIRQYSSPNEPDNFSKELDFSLPNNDDLTEIEFTNILLNDDTKYIMPLIYAKGSVDANFGNFEQIENPPLEDKLVTQSSPSTWSIVGADNYTSQYSISRTDKVEINSNIHDVHEYLFIQSQIIPVKGNQTYTLKIPAYIAPADQNSIYLAVEQGANADEAHDNKSEIKYNFKANSNYQDYTFALTTKPDAKFIVFRLIWHSAGLAKFGNLRLYSGTPNDLESDVKANILPQINIQCAPNISDKWSNAPFKYVDGKRTITGYLQYAMQGDSSRTYPKKNLKLKFFSDEACQKKLKWKPKSDWDKNNKFNLKANYIDATQARNLVNASIFAKATAITPFAFKDHENLAKSQNLGQMEGFPVELYFNGDYYGLMTLNTKKDDKPFGLDSSDPKQEAIVNDTVYNNVFGDSTKTIDGTAFETILQDKASDTLNTNFANFEKFIGTSTDDDFKQHLADYIDINSVINAYLFGNLSRMFDFANKSIILLTWDEGKTYYLTLYDLDSTWGLYWNGSKINSHPEAWSLDPKNPGNSLTMVDGSEAQSNSLYRRIYKLFKPEIKAQYEYLRSNVWSNAQIISAFKKYINSIPEEAYEKEQEKWPDIPSKHITDFAQIQQSIITRGNAMDKYMQNLGSDTKPAVDTADPTAK